MSNLVSVFNVKISDKPLSRKCKYVNQAINKIRYENKFTTKHDDNVCKIEDFFEALLDVIEMKGNR
jgi:hypothetical protein